MVPAPLLIKKILIKRFLKAGATNAQSAVFPKDIRVYQNKVFLRLVSKGIIVDTGDGRFFVDTTAL